MISAIISRLVILVFGTLYPAYASYKAVRTKNLKEYVKWMMYWIVFALFTCTETVTDVFLSWFPFYYEVKIVIVLWLLSPATKGSSILYRKFVHPALCRREQEIDEYIAKAKDQGYHTVLNLGTKGVNYATTVIMQTAIKGGGGLVQQIRKSYSLSDLSECEPRDERADETDDVLAEQMVVRRTAVRSGYNTRRSASESSTKSSIYFSEVDVDVRTRNSRIDEPDLSHIKSSEDISSGYSSADNSTVSLGRTASGGRARARPAPRAALTAVRRPAPAEDSEVIVEELQEDDAFDYTNMPVLVNVTSQLYLSHTNPPFIYKYVGDEIKIVQVLGELPSNDTREQVNKKDDPVVLVDIDKESDSVKNESVCKTIIEKNNVVENSKGIDTNNNENQVTIKEASASLSTVELSEKSEIDTDLNDKNDNEEVTLVPSSVYHNASEESDNENSFGTPEDSPKSKRKFPKGRYGKGKAPPPPDTPLIVSKTDVDVTSTTSLESLNDIVNSLPNTPFKETGSPMTLTVNPIAEKKRRHKSKSPNRLVKTSSAAIGKLLQLPSKIAFWNKNDKGDNSSVSSADQSRRSSIIENVDEFQSCTDLTKVLDNINENIDYNVVHISLREASENETISQDILEKSDALKKLIEAKLESHPEYKVTDIPTTSTSTDV